MSDKHQHRRRSAGSGGKKKGGSGFPRPAPVDTAEQRLIELIVKLGDGTSESTLERHLLDLVGTLVDPSRHPVIIDTVFNCVVALPYKTSIYATLMTLLLRDIGASPSNGSTSTPAADHDKEDTRDDYIGSKESLLASVEREEAVLSFVRRVSLELHKALRNCDYYGIKYLLRFVSELSNTNLIPIELATGLFERILSILTQEKQLPQFLSDFFITCIISSLAINIHSQSTQQNCLSLMTQLMERRKSTSWLSPFDPSKVLPSEGLQVAQLQFTSKDSLEHLFDIWSHDASTSRKPMRVVIRPFELSAISNKLFGPSSDSAQQQDPLLKGPFDWFDSSLFPSPLDVAELVTMKTHIQTQNSLHMDLGLEVLTYPKDLDSCHFTSHKPMCRIFPEYMTNPEGSSAMSPLELWFIEDYVLDIIHFFRSTHAEIPKQISFNKHIDLPDALLCEIILRDLLRIPSSPYPPVHHGVILLDLVQKNPTFTTILVEGTNRLFGSLAAIHPAAVMSLVDWLSYHLSNTEFQWNWMEWSQMVPKIEMEAEKDGQTLAPLSQPYTTFIQDVLSRMIRLSYYDRIAPLISTSVPACASQWLPPKPEPLPPSSAFYLSPLALSILEEIKNRQKPADAVFEPILACGMAVPLTAEQVLQVVVRALLNEGSSSITLLQTTLTKYNSVINKLAYGVQTNLETPKEGGRLILQAALEFYSQSPQHAVIAVLELLHQRLVEASTVISFVLDQETLSQYGFKSFLWEIVDHTIRFVLQSKFVLETEIVNDWKLACRSAEPEEDTRELALATKVKKEAQRIRLEELSQQLQPFLTRLFTILLGLLSNTSTKDLILGHFEALAIKFKRSFALASPSLQSIAASLPVDVQTSFERLKTFAEQF